MAETRQRGSGWSIGLVMRLYALLGYRFSYYLMYPVTFFYFIFATNVKEALKIYYAHLGLPFNSKVYYKHLRIFAICMLDRFVSRIDPESYTYEYDNGDVPIKILSGASILLHSHFGGWAASSNAIRVKNRLNIVMNEAMLGGIKEVEEKEEFKKNIHIIDLSSGTISVSVQIANALLDEEIVAMMGDRAATEKSEIEIKFLGEEARFNKSPFQIAYKMNKPILVYFILFTGIQKYKVEYLRIDMDSSKPEEDAIYEALGTYTALYEKIVKKYPEQWFNLYNFWEKK
ncbi:MAG: lipid A biosynthesis acyltransferase [Campylobacterota bacterium]|nr:lipid A biosynthesis acyltransferase [Campylobacterota bacterium]